jgi:hypothetical protein
MERVVCGPLKMKVTGADVMLANKPCAAFVAIIEQIAGWLAVTVDPTNEQTELVVESA